MQNSTTLKTLKFCTGRTLWLCCAELSLSTWLSASQDVDMTVRKTACSSSLHTVSTWHSLARIQLQINTYKDLHCLNFNNSNKNMILSHKDVQNITDSVLIHKIWGVYPDRPHLSREVTWECRLSTLLALKCGGHLSCSHLAHAKLCCVDFLWKFVPLLPSLFRPILISSCHTVPSSDHTQSLPLKLIA